ncbi:unnamed protein product [Cyclocybe aegerita]|uniref:Arrestin C-terminal-like domain-containing protein n=1 Tax=Cyclocybe aegerita TaxID=1973307 RepID=A0A8S0W7T2_CYCAE|nr:unnamed protein product [Cyclocybe aegerita]
MPHQPLKSDKNSLYIRLTESAVFLRTDGAPGTRRANLSSADRSAMLRGLLVLELVKPTKITSIEVELSAMTSTAWPEGVGARRIEVTEEHHAFHATTTYFNAGKTANPARRTASIGPGVSYAHTLHHHHLHGDFGEDEEEGEWEDLLGRTHGHPSRADDDVVDAPNASANVSRSNSETNSRATRSPHLSRISSLYQPLHFGHQATPPSPAYASSFNSVPLPPSPDIRHQRRMSMDISQLRRIPMHEVHHVEELAPIPPYSPHPLSPGSGASTGGQDSSPSGSSSSLEVPTNAAAQSLEVFRNSLQTTLQNLQPPSRTSSESSLHPDRSASRPPSFGEAIPEDEALHEPPALSPSSVQPELSPILGPSTITGPTPRQQSSARSRTPSIHDNRDSGSYSRPQTASPPARAPNPSTERGRRGSRFSFSAVSNIFMDAVRTTSPRTSKLGQSRERGREPSADGSPRGAGGSRSARGRAGASQQRGRTMERGLASPLEMDIEAEEADAESSRVREPKERGRGIGKILKDWEKEHLHHKEGWKEFKKGTYSYPISFSIPSNAPPTMFCDFGSVSWRLKATVHRPGVLKSKLTAARDVVIIACPTEEDTEDTENIIVERHWDQQLQYLISISGRSFHIGGTVPVSFTLMPLTKVKIHRISVLLEERVDYYTNMRRIARSDPPTRFTLLSIRGEGKGADPILPLESDDVEVLRNSPLFQIINQEDDLGEIASNLMGPGPWSFHRDLKLPSSCDILKFTNRNRRSNILVTHLLKLIMRVERGDDLYVDKSGRRKMFDIVVQTPVLILSCRCNPEWTSLPRYSEAFDDPTNFIPSCPCQVTREQGDIGFRSALERVTSRHSSDSAASAAETSPIHPNSMRSLRQLSFSEAIVRSSNLFERLISGQESETGEAPPAYDIVSPRPHVTVSPGVAVL